MATYSGANSVPYLIPDGAQRAIIGNYDVTVDGAVDGTYKSIGALPAGARLSSTAIIQTVEIETAFDGTTPLIDVFLKPFNTTTIDTTALIPNTVPTEGTTGAYYNTAANVKSAGYLGKLSQPYEVLIKFSGGGSNTAGKANVIIPFHHDLDPTSY